MFCPPCFLDFHTCIRYVWRCRCLCGLSTMNQETLFGVSRYQASQNVQGILEKRNRLRAIQKRIDELTELDSEAAQNGDFDAQFESLYAQLYAIKDELEKWEKSNVTLQANPNVRTEVADVIEGLQNHPVEYNDLIVRQLVECIKVTDADVLNVYFKDETEINVEL